MLVIVTLIFLPSEHACSGSGSATMRGTEGTTEERRDGMSGRCCGTNSKQKISHEVFLHVLYITVIY